MPRLYLRHFVILITFIIGSASFALAQRRVDDRDFGERIVLIVPIVGDGTPRNPFRPLFAPLGADEMKASGIIAYTSVLSDDKKFALVELVATDRKAFGAILNDTRQDIKKFDQAKGDKKEDIEKEFRKLKKDFDFGKFKEGK